MSRYLVMPSPSQAGTGIVTSGLVGYWDAGNSASYPRTGNTWTALAGSANGTLSNGPTFSAERGGTITTDGSNDVINFGDACDLTNNGTLCVMARIKTLPPNTSTFGTLIVKYQASPARANYVINVNSNAIQAAFNSTGNWRIANTGQVANDIAANVWIMFGATFEQSGINTVIRLWRNGANFHTATLPNNISGNSGSLELGGVVVSGSTAEPLHCEYGALLIYNRVLSSTEMLQNFNAFRGRFGI